LSTDTPRESRQKLTANQTSMLSILEESGPAGLPLEDWNERTQGEEHPRT